VRIAANIAKVACRFRAASPAGTGLHRMIWDTRDLSCPWTNGGIVPKVPTPQKFAPVISPASDVKCAFRLRDWKPTGRCSRGRACRGRAWPVPGNAGCAHQSDCSDHTRRTRLSRRQPLGGYPSGRPNFKLLLRRQHRPILCFPKKEFLVFFIRCPGCVRSKHSAIVGDMRTSNASFFC
jgi:hypothetical protein